MGSVSDLKAKAEGLRGMQSSSKAGAPVDTGKRLATVARSESEEIRISWQLYQGKPFLSMRMWRKSPDGQWWPQKDKGITFRVHELPDLAVGVEGAIDIATQARKDWQASKDQQNQGRGYGQSGPREEGPPLWDGPSMKDVF